MTMITITSAVELSSSQQDDVKKAAIKKYGKETTFSFVINPDLIGGVTIAVNSRLLDGSVHNKLEQLRQHIRQS